MAKEVNIRAADGFMKGEDKTIQWDIVDTSGSPVDMAAWTLSWVLRRAQNSGGTAILTKTPTAQTVNSVASRARVVIAAADTSSLAPGAYAYSLARTDSGYRSILAYGYLILLPVTARAS